MSKKPMTFVPVYLRDWGGGKMERWQIVQVGGQWYVGKPWQEMTPTTMAEAMLQVARGVSVVQRPPHHLHVESDRNVYSYPGPCRQWFCPHRIKPGG